MLIKAIPGLHNAPLSLRLKDGKEMRIREFWALFIFDEIFIQRYYDAPEVVSTKGVKNIIDIGANIGCFSLRAKQISPDATILAFEPDPSNFSMLQENLRLSGVSSVSARQEGVSDSCGCFDLYLSPRNIGGHSMYRRSGHSVSIQTRTLTDALALFGESVDCDILKIDCEGCEFAVLTPLDVETAARIRTIILEPEPTLYDLPFLKAHLNNLGFTLKEFGSLIVAHRPSFD
jgi:FkbM family methyltransferase